MAKVGDLVVRQAANPKGLILDEPWAVKRVLMVGSDGRVVGTSQVSTHITRRDAEAARRKQSNWGERDDGSENMSVLG